MAGRAQAAAIDEHIIGADSPVALEHESTESSPAIMGNLVFWADTRPVLGYPDFPYIFFRDLSRPDEPERMLTPQPEYFSRTFRGQSNPVARDGIVAWQETVTTPSGGIASEPRYIILDECGLPDSCSVHRVFVPPSLIRNMSVGSGKLVWEDDRSGNYWESDIYGFDTATGLEFPVCTAPGKQSEPAVSGEWVVWQDNRGGTFGNNGPTKNDLYARNLSTGQERRLTTDEGTVFQVSPSISGTRVVFQAYKTFGVTFSKIVSIDLSTNESKTLYSGPEVNQNPYIDGDRVVWDNRNGVNGCRIWLFDMTTGVSQPVSAGSQAVSPQAKQPAMSADRIVWSDYRTGVWTVYQNRIGDTGRTLAERYKPELHFRHDINDSGRDDFEPRPASLLVDVPGTSLVRGGSSITNPNLEQLTDGTDADSYIDLTGNPVMNSYSDYNEPYINQISQDPFRYPITAHARVVAHAEGSNKTVIQYWMCYYYNDWINNHEGDWEMVEVVIDENLEPEKAAYSQHANAFAKGWNEEGITRNDTHPLVFVAAGSHANYFDNGLWGTHYHQGKLDVTGDTSSSTVALDAGGLADIRGWSAFAGHWGELQVWWPPVWLPPFVEGGPRGPVGQGGAWETPLSWADGATEKADDNDLLAEMAGAVGIRIEDASGQWIGQGAGTDAGRLPSSEYFERAADGTRNIVVHNSDITGALHLVITALETGPASLSIKLPDFAGGAVHTVLFQGLDLPAFAQGVLYLDSAQPVLKLDTNGDGIYEEQLQPTSAESNPMDFLPPDAVTDLKAASGSSAAVTLSWTMPADAGAPGGVSRFEIRNAEEPITDDNWQRAKQAGEIPGALTPGTTAQFEVSELQAGATYYFAVRSRDDAWQPSALSNVVAATTQAPQLTWSRLDSYWATFADFLGRRLTVSYRLGNEGSQKAVAAAVNASNQTVGVQLDSPLPVVAGDLEPGSSAEIRLCYLVPPGTNVFRTKTYASCLDDTGRTHWFPGPPPVS